MADRGLAGIFLANSLTKSWRSRGAGNTFEHFAVADSETIKAFNLAIHVDTHSPSVWNFLTKVKSQATLLSRN